MSINTVTTKFSNISEDPYLRLDAKYHNFLNSAHWKLFDSGSEHAVRLKDILVDDFNIFPYEEGEEYKGIPTGQSYIDEDGYIVDFDTVTLEDHPNRLKYKINNNNILISSLRLAKSPAAYFSDMDLSDYVFSNGFYIYQVQKDWNIKFILYLLRTKKIKEVLDNNLYRGIGISAYKDFDLKRLLIPVVSKTNQDIAVKEIEPIEKNIKELKVRIKPVQVIIDEIFTREFCFNIERFNQYKRQRSYNSKLSEYANNEDLRFSVNYHNLAGSFVLKELKALTSKKIKHFISEPITLGASISPSDFDENGEYYYISMATVKNYRLELDDTQLVSDTYVKANMSKAVSKNDIIMTRSGVAIGKFALIEDDINGIYADFTMRIRLENYNFLFAYYYFRSTYFQCLVHTFKKGLQNKNIFPGQIQELPMLDISIERQNKIVNEIKEVLDEQDQIKSQIAQERLKIDKIIEKAFF